MDCEARLYRVRRLLCAYDLETRKCRHVLVVFFFILFLFPILCFASIVLFARSLHANLFSPFFRCAGLTETALTREHGRICPSIGSTAVERWSRDWRHDALRPGPESRE